MEGRSTRGGSTAASSVAAAAGSPIAFAPITATPSTSTPNEQGGLSLMTYRYMLMVGVIAFGAFNTIMKGAENKSYSVGIDGQSVKFKKPWTQTAFMFFGELTALLYFYTERWCMNQSARRRQRADRASGKVPLLMPDDGLNATTATSSGSGLGNTPVWLFLPPACLDLLGTAFGSIGLLYVSPSVWQMLRGCSVIFSALLSIAFLGRKLYSFHWIGISITFVGLAIVGVSSIISSTSDVTSTTGQKLFGIGILMIGLLCNSAQLIVEELFLKKRNVPPALVVGSEGLWGVIAMSVVMTILYFIPGSDKGSYENVYDSAVMIGNNSALTCFVIGQWAALWWYNFLALKVTKSLSAVHRTLLDAFRTIFVWTLNLFIFYAIDDRYGESWGPYSYVQVIGFVVLIVGMVVYNRLVDLPCITYDGNVGKMTQTEPAIKPAAVLATSDSPTAVVTQE